MKSIGKQMGAHPLMDEIKKMRKFSNKFKLEVDE
jgi:hypothetical protein